MAENIIIVLINLSWQFILIYALSKLILTAFRIHSASIKNIVWLCVVLSPIILFPMNMIASDWVLINPSYHRPELTNPEINTNQNIDLFLKGIGHEGNLSNEIIDNSSKTKSLSSQVSFKHILNKIPLFLSIIWIVVVNRGIIILSVGLVKLKKLILRADKVMDNAVFNGIKEKLGLTRQIHLLASSEIQIPFSTGFICSYVIIPSDMDISNDRLQMILTHELAHLKRYDNFTNIICQITKAFIFFHPLYYLAMREFSLSSEQICDIYAVGITNKRDDYAQCLVDFSQAKMGLFSMGFSAGRNSISKRIGSILNEKEVIKMTKKKVAFLLASFIFIMLVLSSIRLINPAFARQFMQESAKVIFSSSPPAPFGEQGNMDIFTADTSNPNWTQPEAWVRLTDDPNGERYPIWSPDGKKIAFVSEGNQMDLFDDEIYIMDADGKNQIRLTKNNDRDTSPRWSPDGSRIAFYRFTQADRVNGIYIMDADGNNVERIAEGNYILGSLDWAPDGKKIAFNKASITGGGISVVDIDGKNMTTLTDGQAYDWWASWSPDGTKIAFSSDRENHSPVDNKSLWDVYVMNADGSDQRNVTNSPETSQTPWCWTSDGKIIYGIGSSPWIIDADGNNKQVIRDGGLIDIDWLGPSPVLSVEPAGKLKSLWGWIKTR